MIRRLFALFMVLFGLGVVLASGAALFWSEKVQQVYSLALPIVEHASRPTFSSDGPEAERGKPIGMLQVPRLGISSVVLEGDDVAELLFGVGHLADTPLPWHNGNSVFAAHRDTFFRPLAGIRRNDIIKFSTADAEFEYVVRDMKIVAPTDVDVLDPTPTATLTLITCYPFDYIGAAPSRFIVTAERRSRPT